MNRLKYQDFLFFTLFFISIFLFVWGGISFFLWIFIIQPLATFEAFNTILHLNEYIATFLQHGGILVGKPLYFFSIYPYIYLNDKTTYPPFLPAWPDNQSLIWIWQQESIATILWKTQTFLDYFAWFLTFTSYGALLLASLYLTKIVLGISWRECSTYFVLLLLVFVVSASCFG